MRHQMVNNKVNNSVISPSSRPCSRARLLTPLLVDHSLLQPLLGQGSSSSSSSSYSSPDLARPLHWDASRRQGLRQDHQHRQLSVLHTLHFKYFQNVNLRKPLFVKYF